MKKLLGDTNWSTYTGRLHVGIDTLTKPPVLSLVDDVDFRVHECWRLPERPVELIRLMKDAGPAIADVVVLARRDGYDLVDRIADAGFKVNLLTPAELRRYAGIRNVTEKHNAYWMAHLLRARALPFGEIYWTADIHDAHPHPRHHCDKLPSLSSRLRLFRMQDNELYENNRYSKNRRH